MEFGKWSFNWLLYPSGSVSALVKTTFFSKTALQHMKKLNTTKTYLHDYKWEFSFKLCDDSGSSTYFFANSTIITFWTKQWIFRVAKQKDVWSACTSISLKRSHIKANDIIAKYLLCGCSCLKEFWYLWRSWKRSASQYWL